MKKHPSSSLICPVCSGGVKYLFEKKTFHIFKCRNCGLGFLDPLPTFEEIESLYNSKNYYHSEGIGYMDYSILEEGYKKMYKKFLRDIEEKYDFTVRDKNILDIGCAYGFFLDVAKEAGASELWGTDITAASEKIVLDKEYKFLRGAFEVLEVPENYFDLIFMGDVFEHLFDPFEAVKKLYAILKPGGIIILTTINFNSLFVKVMRKNWRLLIPPEHIYYWTKESVRILFNKNRLEGICKGYTLFIPKKYLLERFKQQFSFNPLIHKLIPFTIIPIRSFDTIECVFQKRL